MEENIGKEIVRLVREIGEDERDLRRAEGWNDTVKMERLKGSINRKLQLIEILKK